MENQLTLARLICLTSALENCRRKAFLESDSKPTCVLWWFEREPDEISLASLKLAYANALLVHSGTSEKNLCNTSENWSLVWLELIKLFCCSCAVIFCWGLRAFSSLGWNPSQYDFCRKKGGLLIVLPENSFGRNHVSTGGFWKLFLKCVSFLGLVLFWWASPLVQFMEQTNIGKSVAVREVHQMLMWPWRFVVVWGQGELCPSCDREL